MRIPTFLQTKFLLPRQNPEWLPRPHLTAWMERQRARRVIIISAPAGFGKTTLLSNYLHTSQRITAWYQLDVLDNDPSVFLAYLTEAFRQAHRHHHLAADSAFGEATLALLENLDENPVAHQQILTVLLNELFEIIGEGWVLVLEDYHIITNPHIHQLVDYLIENAPPGLQIIISSRTMPPLRLARLRARGLLAERHSSDLRFTPEEIRDWFRQQTPQLSEESIRLLDEKTGGWAAALQIVRSSIQNQDTASAEQFIAELSGTHRFIFDYLAEEVFQRLPVDWQAFLTATSVLEQMDAATCNHLLRREDALEMLERLESANLCQANRSGKHKWFTYHQLFREFLLGKLRREAPHRLTTLEARAAQFYATQGAWELAFQHYLQAGQQEKAAEALEHFARDFVEHGRVEALKRYLTALDAKTLHAHPELLLQRGNVLRRLGEVGAAVVSYRDARWGFSKYGDRAGICSALTRLAEVNYFQGRYERARELATEALRQATADDHAERAHALMSLAKSEGFLVGMDNGRALAEEAVEEAHRAGDSMAPLVKANLLQSLGQICWWHGDPQATIRYCEEALQVAPDRLAPTTARTYITLASPYLYRRDLDKALRYAEEGLNIAQTLHLVELLPSAYAVLGNVLTRLGETVRAENSLRQAMETAERLGIASYERVMATGYLAYNLANQGRLDEARQLVESALWSYTGPPDTYDVFVCRSVLADIALEKQHFSLAERLYLDLLPSGMQHQFRIPLAMVYFGLAYIALVEGREQAGLDYARKSLALIEATRTYQLYLDQGERSRVVCTVLQKHGYDTPFVRRVLESLQTAAEASAPPEIAAVSPQAVVVQTLGAFRVTVNGEEITQERWVSTKARDLLAYFITFRGERIPAERAFEALWRDRAGRGKTAFHTALSRLRKALRGKERTIKYILLESSEYWLDTARFVLDVDEFEAALRQAREATSPTAAMAWYQRALSHYQGEYLPNLYYDWVFPERRRLQQAYLDALVALAHLLANQGDHNSAAEHLEKAIALDPLNEELYLPLMQSYAAMGNRAEVARLYKRLSERLREELGVSPLPETQEAYKRLVGQGGLRGR